MKERKFVGLKKKDFFKVFKKKFFRDGKTTICVIDVRINALSLMPLLADTKEAKRFIRRYSDLKFNNKGFFVFSRTGKAICSEEDTYDEKLGCNIADAKAEMKVFDLVSRILMYAHHRLEHKSDTFYKASKYLELCLEKEHNFVHRL